MESSHFLLGVPTDMVINELTRRSEAAPIEIVTYPLAFLSPPTDRSSLRADLTEGDEFNLRCVHHGFVHNPNTGITEFLVFVQVVNETILTDLGVDIANFRPYFRLATSPMRTRKIRFWCKNFGDALMGLEFPFSFIIRDDPVLVEQFNQSAMTDHEFSYSDGL